MKLFYLAMLVIFFQVSTFARTWNIRVADYSFSPANVNAEIGDVIQFEWISGTHTTTCGAGLQGTSLPPGAPEWDEEMSSSYPSFSYTLLVEGNYLYGCTPHFASGMQGNITVSSTLPVKFGYFTVSDIKRKAVLEWNTFSESNTNYFSIRKSKDGSNFFEIGKINAAGNSNYTKSYQFEDTDLGNFDKYIYYEVVTIDADKRESFSPIRTFRNNYILRDNLMVALSPNPITRPGQVQLKFNADKSGEMEVSVCNLAGQIMLRSKMAAFYGLNSGHLHICDLDPGIYNIIFSLGGKKEIKKVVIQ